MRVISQDGTKDFPYDSSSVSVYAGCINGRVYVRMQLCGYDDSVDVADYSTEEKAKKAMKQLRDVYEDYLAEGTPDGNGFCFVPPKVFQFPTEEELE